MGSDNIFHKRKERLVADFKRRGHTRQSNKRYLIVCEGTKLDQIYTLGKPFFAITSTPSFEFWLLLHFAYTDAPFHKAGKKSVGQQVIAQLKQQPQFKHYDKGATNTFALLASKLADAKANAKKLRENADPPSASQANPWTNVDQLVNALTDNDFDLFEADHA
ncbi:MAG: RloB family protein [Cytophagales bacterium]|nr:RloB family protein [Cytophagales bacterium]